MTRPTENKLLFGFWLYILSDCLLFAALFATYAVLRGATAGSITPHDLLNLRYVFAETIALLVSNLMMGIALVHARDDNHSEVLKFLALTLLFGFIFLGLEVNEFWRLVAEGNGPS